MSRGEQDVLDRIRAAMRGAKLDIKGLGEQCGVPYQTMQSYLGGRRRLPASLIGAIARATDTSCDWLLTGKPWAPHPYALLIAVAGLTQILRARPDDDPSLAYGELMASLYLTYRREYLNRFRDPKNVHMSSAEVHEEADVLKRIYELGGSSRKL